MDALLKRPLAARPAAVDGAVTALIAVVIAAVSSDVAFLQGIPRWAGVAIAALAVLPAAWRRRWPRAVLVVTTVAWAVAAALSPSPAPVLGVAFSMYVIPLRFGLRDALKLLAGTLLVLAAGLACFAFLRHGAYRAGGTTQAAALLLESGLLVAIAWMAGYVVRQKRAYLAGRQEQAEERARAQLAEARRAGTEERLRIAREVHDVVAHTMSVIAVQAGVAGYVGRTDPGEAIRALSSIEETSRGALREMRALLAVLRAEGSSPRDGDLGPAPGLADLGALTARAAEAGLRVDTDVRGEPRRLAAGLDLAAYRVIQEAVTNVIKHAATDRCTVIIEYREDTLTLEIADDGAGGAADSPGAGHGLAGMRERVGMYGGEFRAGPRPGRGFQVTARFPVQAAVP